MKDSWILSPVVLATAVLVLSAIASWLRSVTLWYWRVNEGIDLLREIRDELRELNSRGDEDVVGEVLKFPRRASRGGTEPR
ncbi:hypothetical protein [Paraburkholderia tuberum]|uniref:hypothetical protein n=1 Tax=Paraburkholderia tuberum TaxID=157910 RepID=UPI00115F8411|nr:hypothetical protein [Paraburkholderia tuberum]